ncbi:MAG: peptidoglycan-binding protein [Synechococcales cyanobacterium C42_A2020_086]|nr:peptidoglycan-binding protein [Synechococcales cyanobacterium C42_A2020_086]
MNLLVPNVLVSFEDLDISANSAAVHAFLQPAAKDALRRAIQSRGKTLVLTSAYRTVAQQYLLWSWYQKRQCGISRAAEPGLSNHEDGLALDTPDFDAWRFILASHNWQWLGDGDPVHFTYMGRGVRDDIGSIGLKAFQILWNKHNPGDQIKEDGLFGPKTASRLDQSPAEGFGATRLLKLTTPNMQGEDVRRVQETLVQAGLLTSNEVDGIFGINTEIAVKNFQERNGLSKDGSVGPQTLRLLGGSITANRSLQLVTVSDRWLKALLNAPTTGASPITASQDGLPGGIASSHTMANTDLLRVKGLAAMFRQVGAKFDVPVALIAALASRESRCGNVLDRGGWGDRGNAFGILQVDKNYHTPRGTHNPSSLEHIEQAIGIFVDYRQQVQAKHPTWEDEYVLKGATVAYNSGVSNVQTKAGMDIGTAGGDYGSDVIARAQFYSNHL